MTLAVQLVQNIAHHGTCSKIDFLTLMASISNLFPTSTAEVYGGLAPLRNGLSSLIELLEEPGNSTHQERFKYLLGIIVLEQKLQKRSDLIEILGRRLEHYQRQQEHFGIEHENIAASAASIYMDTLSTFSMRIQVMGSPEYLKQSQNAEKIRALLLAGIRAATLFRQTGGKRWHLLLKRKSILQIAKKSLHEVKEHYPLPD